MKTEIFGTLGPGCDSEELLAEMFRRGMTGIRLNLSHASLRDSAEQIRRFQLAAERAGKHPELLIDMQGPELRVGRLASSLSLDEGEIVQMGDGRVPLPPAVISAACVNDILLLDDGRIEGTVEGKTDTSLDVRITRGGVLNSRKSVKIIGRTVQGPVLTAEDLVNIRDAKEFGVTALMQPFVHSGGQLEEVRQALQDAGCADLRLFAKIEDCEGIRNLRDIVPQADMVVIARGDLGNDMPLWQLPAACMAIEAVCREYGKPFLMVTQMLYTMLSHPVPTRAEVSDIFHAVAEGAAAVMVTNETAVGMYPGEVIRYLANTAESAEEYRRKRDAGQSV